jgi:excisionase family DNA binding protein
MSRMMTVDQAAERLQVKPNTIRTWIKEGRIPGRKIGRVYRIPETALDAFVREVPMPASPPRRLTGHDLLGRFPRPERPLDVIMREKHEEVDAEEREWNKAHPSSSKGEAAA